MIGNLFIVSAPSGAGKSSLVKAAARRRQAAHAFDFVYDSGAPPGEVDGREYHFVDRKTFEAMLERGDFLESAEVHGNRYGTSQKWIEGRAPRSGHPARDRLAGRAAGAQSLPRRRGHLHRSSAPGADRARAPAAWPGTGQRGSHPAPAADAREEISHLAEFDYVIINKEFEEARRDLAAVVRAARLKLSGQIARHPEILKPFG